MPSFSVSKYREGGYDRRLMHHDSDRSWITNPDPDHPKGMHPKLLTFIMNNPTQCRVSADNLFTTLYCYVLFVCAHWCVEWMRILLRLHWALTPHKTKWYQIIYQRKSTSAHKWTQASACLSPSDAISGYFTCPSDAISGYFTCLWTGSWQCLSTKFKQSLRVPKGLWVSILGFLTVIRELRVSGIISPWT